MTGSGKTGLCIGLLEEAALDGIPAVVIDPKGDLANLLLTFPDLEARGLPALDQRGRRAQEGDDPRPVRRAAGGAVAQGPGRLGAGRRSASGGCGTRPSSSSTPRAAAPGIPVSILRSFDAPAASILEDPDLLRERIITTVTSLLDLLGLDTDPLQSREHILLSTVLETPGGRGAAWTSPA